MKSYKDGNKWKTITATFRIWCVHFFKLRVTHLKWHFVLFTIQWQTGRSCWLQKCFFQWILHLRRFHREKSMSWNWSFFSVVMGIQILSNDKFLWGLTCSFNCPAGKRQENNICVRWNKCICSGILILQVVDISHDLYKLLYKEVPR